jgi:hypothetical protein
MAGSVHRMAGQFPTIRASVRLAESGSVDRLSRLVSAGQSTHDYSRRHGAGSPWPLGAVRAGGSDELRLVEKPPAGKTCLDEHRLQQPAGLHLRQVPRACLETRDCQLGQRCVKSATGSVCQLEEEKRCPATGACMQPLICAIDLLCRNNCTSAVDCPPSQVCASGVLRRGVRGRARRQAQDRRRRRGRQRRSTAARAARRHRRFSRDRRRPPTPPAAGSGPCGIPDMEPNDMRDQAVKIAPAPSPRASAPRRRRLLRAGRAR